MEGVEDIPHPVLVDGLPWTWETYPQYLDFLGARPLRHGHLRLRPRTGRCASTSWGSAARIASPHRPRTCSGWPRSSRQAVRRRGHGVQHSRTFFHRSSDGRSTPSFEAAEAELMALAGALREGGHRCHAS